MGDLREPNVAVAADSPSPSPSSSPSRPDPFLIGSERWAWAERVTQEIIGWVQPTVMSEERRRAVIDYVQRLIRNSLGCQVFPFGSVPLKTYLPDGDIDLTAFGDFNLEEALVNDVYSVLEAEDRNPAAECTVKDVQYISAEVKLVKCLVQNIVVDISFNQIGGLCTLCFLEQVDHRIGKDHLFKRSIILIKAWCYYESRILGAYHGLISTYALETLVLYIFNLFHSSLDGPLAVLYKFLDYYSKFDWQNFCVSLHGPVHISSLPEIVAEKPENGGGDLLFGGDFLNECVEMFSVPSRGNELSSRAFVQKHLNIVDPLKEHNNLGRSVSKGNFFRIRSAFSLGARKLGQILTKPKENIDEEVQKFFANMLYRHGRGQRRDVQDPLSTSLANGLACKMPQDGSDQSESIDPSCISSKNTVGPVGPQPSSGNNVGESKEVHEKQRQNPYVVLAQAGRAKDDRISASASGSSGDMESKSQASGNEKMSNGDSDESQLLIAGFGDDKVSSQILQSYDKDTSLMSLQQEDAHLVASVDFNDGSSATAPNGDLFEDLDCSHQWWLPTRMAAGLYETPRPLPDLTGDYGNHFNSLQYGRWWYDYASSQFDSFQRKNPWDMICHSVQLRQNLFANINANPVISGPPFFPVNYPMVHGAAAFSMEELPKARGTGTYFPITNLHSYRERSHAPKVLKSPRNHGRSTMPGDKNSFPRNNRDPTQAQSSVQVGSAKAQSLDSHDNSSPRGNADRDSNGYVVFGSLGHLQLESPSSVGSQEPNTEPPAPGMQMGKPRVFTNDDRYAEQSYHLKDEDDFPPLSSV
ncbi:hypothetical protein Nepgr_028224 [Nepenthes gracilis]|uniref:PAP-associated domain-containing protein n=1 Tax=Nepenthes gracilis TaxID=150966 RepID=A0AAD3TC21_NEPGR|nr:hypothetical protein Nepgr_028224 [Nepenthes gracilis]